MKLIQDATIINEGESFIGSVLISGHTIKAIYRNEPIPNDIEHRAVKINAKGLWLLPGVIDDQVHFRDPGLTQKGDIESESRAAVAGGVTSYMDMPNTKPQTTTIGELNRKFEIAAEKSHANYSFYLGASNENIDELKKADPKDVCGIKLFMGASTGNMLVDQPDALQRIFAEVDMLIATHCEKEEIIKKNIAKYKDQFSGDIPIEYHPLIRSEEACYRSSAEAVELADKYGSRLHILHLSTKKEIGLFDIKPLSEKRITGEVCVHHLWFSEEDYARYGTLIKWNPAIKTQKDRDALLIGLLEGKIDIVATDHAPHLMDDKIGGCLLASSGAPLVQHSLQLMLELVKLGKITKEQVVEKMCHAPADLFKIIGRGYIREGYYADLVLVDPNQDFKVEREGILYKCGWSPIEGETLSTTVVKTFVNGDIAFDRGITHRVNALPLRFDR